MSSSPGDATAASRHRRARAARPRQRRDLVSGRACRARSSGRCRWPARRRARPARASRSPAPSSRRCRAARAARASVGSSGAPRCSARRPSATARASACSALTRWRTMPSWPMTSGSAAASVGGVGEQLRQRREGRLDGRAEAVDQPLHQRARGLHRDLLAEDHAHRGLEAVQRPGQPHARPWRQRQRRQHGVDGAGSASRSKAWRTRCSTRAEHRRQARRHAQVQFVGARARSAPPASRPARWPRCGQPQRAAQFQPLDLLRRRAPAAARRSRAAPATS